MLYLKWRFSARPIASRTAFPRSFGADEQNNVQQERAKPAAEEEDDRTSDEKVFT